MQHEPLTISQLNRYAKALLEENDNLRGVLAAGEISNFKKHSSGHWYFSLKDAGASVPAVMFRESNRRLGFVPHDGTRVLVRGRVSLYERDGKFQLYAEDMQPDGLGALYMAYAQQKERFENEGLFDKARKRPLPWFPRRVGVVTSGTGAAVQDILHILARRCPAAQVVLCPVQVQGQGAAQQIARAIALLNARQAADVLIVGRGGGSLEDLWAFNEEIVVRAVVASQIPVVSAVGHETDTVLCDFAADLRAPTPSAAAELAVPDLDELLEGLRDAQGRMLLFARQGLRERRQALEVLCARRVLQSPGEILNASRQRLDSTTLRLQNALQNSVQAHRLRLSRLSAQLDAMSPLKVLGRGFALASKGGKIVRSTAQLSPGDQIGLRLRDGSCEAIIWGIT
ncbi:MAG: exodeoxyribonuclease VII large subunit [Oscillospiraceae bacterium]|jgi:exodeoxyribonuclease VII large subunit|nr:exodeoxyribonuclease VII large subunit [Oscillospiraceae bacterium]